MDKVNYKEASHSKSRLKKDYIIGSVTNIVRHLVNFSRDFHVMDDDNNI